uniref:Secreted protein n=1 Tax=Angiostrongylus cantonensis TaxID=6313 RepID=A0A0K0D7X5_ANGCA
MIYPVLLMTAVRGQIISPWLEFCIKEQRWDAALSVPRSSLLDSSRFDDGEGRHRKRRQLLWTLDSNQHDCDDDEKLPVS